MVIWEWLWMGEKKPCFSFSSSNPVIPPALCGASVVRFSALQGSAFMCNSSVGEQLAMWNCMHTQHSVQSAFDDLRCNEDKQKIFPVFFYYYYIYWKVFEVWSWLLSSEAAADIKNDLFFSMTLGANVSVNRVFTLLCSFLFHCGQRAEIKVEPWTFFDISYRSFRIGNGSWHCVLRKSKRTCKALCSSANEDIPRLDRVIWSFCIWQKDQNLFLWWYRLLSSRD